MAKQKGIFKVEGTLNDVTFLKTSDGYLVKEKSEVSGDRIKSDPRFARTRENGEEFGRAGKAGKELRNAFQTLLLSCRDKRMVSRLVKEMMKVIKTDTVNDRGSRTAENGVLQLLQGFDFNVNAKLSATLYAPYTPNIDRAAGNLKVFIPSFVPGNSIIAPAGATHYQIVSSGAEVDFTSGTYLCDQQESGVLPLDNTPTAVINLTNSVTANSRKPLFLVLGIQFYQMVNGKFYTLSNGAYNALNLVGVDA